MTDAGWAERKVQAALYTPHKTKLALIQTVSKLLKAEHRRAVRAVQRQLDLYQRQREVEKDKCTRDLLAGSILACVELLESLQRGRE